MNHHYIEYMIREQRREEIEACNRLRMLKHAGHLDTGFVMRLRIVVSRGIKMWKEHIVLVCRAPFRFFSRRNPMIHQKEGVV